MVRGHWLILTASIWAMALVFFLMTVELAGMGGYMAVLLAPRYLL